MKLARCISSHSASAASCNLRRKVRSGSITLAGSDVTALAPAARHVGYVPQGGVLFSTMTVRENIGFALRVRGDSRTEVAARVGELAEQLEVAHLLDRGPQFLSGGERHRVALGRALASRPPVLLLDEPLASLDDDTALPGEAAVDLDFRLLDGEACACRDYPNRSKQVPDCVRLTAKNVRELSWLPPSCACNR